jgi:hypothetical protein
VGGQPAKLQPVPWRADLQRDEGRPLPARLPGAGRRPGPARLAARLATTPGRRATAFRLLIASLVVTMAADMLLSVLTLSGATTTVTDGMYLVD